MKIRDDIKFPELELKENECLAICVRGSINMVLVEGETYIIDKHSHIGTSVHTADRQPLGEALRSRFKPI